MDRCHLYLPLTDSSGAPYPFAEVTLLDPVTGTEIGTPVYTEPTGGSAQLWPVLVAPAIIDLWTDRPMRVTLAAQLPGGASLTRSGVDILPSPPTTVRSTRPLRLQEQGDISSGAILSVSPGGLGVWQVLDALRAHAHDGDAPGSTVLGPADLTDIYPGQTWVGGGVGGAQGVDAVALGTEAIVGGAGALAAGAGASAGEDGTSVGGGTASASEALALGSGALAPMERQVVLGHATDGTKAGSEAVLFSGAPQDLADAGIHLANGVHTSSDGAGLTLGTPAQPAELTGLVSSDGYLNLNGAVVFPRYLSARKGAVLGSATSPLSFFGAAGAHQPTITLASLPSSAPGYAALSSLLRALDQLGLIYLSDLPTTLTDDLDSFNASSEHTNLSLQTSAIPNYSDPTRVSRTGAGPATLTYTLPKSVRDLRLNLLWPGPPPTTSAVTSQFTAALSLDGASWTPIPLAIDPFTALDTTWARATAGNRQPLPTGTRLRLSWTDSCPLALAKAVIRPVA